jgi:hypothetical protein
VIRSVVTIRFKPATGDEQIERFTQALLALEIAGMTARSCGRDVGLRPEAADYAIVLDFEDAAAYHRYHADADHERLRSGLSAEIVESAMLCQFEC